MTSFEAPDDPGATRLLRQRIRSGLRLVLAAALSFILINLSLPLEGARAVVALLSLQVIAAAAALVLLRRENRRIPLSPVALASAAIACVTSAAAGVMSNNHTANPLLFILLTMGSATMLPWGVGPQLVTVAIAAAALLWNFSAVGVSLEAFGYPTAVAVVVAFVTSVYIAYELERQRTVVAREMNDRRIAEHALHLSQERYATAVQAGAVGVWDWDLISGELYLDPVLKELLGYAEDELPNRMSDWKLRGHPEDQALVLEQMNAHLKGKTPRYEFEHRLLRKDGTARWFLARGRAVRNDRGEPIRLLGAETDITALKALDRVQREEGEVSATLLRAAQVALAAIDTPLLLDRLCAVVTEALQSDRSHTWLWQTSDDTYVAVAGSGDHPDQWEFVRAVRIPASLLAPLIGELERSDVAELDSAHLSDLLPPSLTERLGATRAVFMALRRGPRLIGMQSAEYAHPPAEVSSTHRRIAQGIAHLASLGIQYARVVDELERANRLKSEFVATMSHELRTPLHAIIGYNDLVLDGDFGPLNDEQSDALTHVRRSARHLCDVIDGILDLSRLERGQLPLQEEDVCLPELIARIDEEMRATLEKPSIRFRWQIEPDLPAIRSDAGKLSVVLKNVIENAFKFTAAGEVTVAVRASNGNIELRVTDTGIGIAPETLPIIFEPFRQAERYLTRRYDGLGLGLYVARRLVEVLGGTIQVESAVGRGSSFCIAIPHGAIPPNEAAAVA